MTIGGLRGHDITAARRDELPGRTGADLEELLALVGVARLVLIGEASHGTPAECSPGGPRPPAD